MMWQRVYPYACLNIDCSWAQWLEAVLRTIYTPYTRSSLNFRIARYFSSQDNVLITACARTIFDLYLQAMSFPLGSEVLMTAINIPEMSRILRYHGLIPVPVDLNLDTLAASPEAVEKAITPRTKCIVVAMVYGTRYDLGPIAEVAKRHRLPIFEDCAEGFCGIQYSGSSHAAVSMFSFGPIKTCTAFGGAVAVVRDPRLYSAMNAIHSQYPPQPNALYLKKVVKYALGIIMLNIKFLHTFVRPLARKVWDYKKFVVGLMRGFPPSKDLLGKYRIQPAMGLLAFLHRRLKTFNPEDFEKSMRNLTEGQKILSEGGIMVPGHLAEVRNFWLFPVIANNPAKSYDRLTDANVDAYRGISQLDAVEAPVGSAYEEPRNVQQMFDKLVYLPLHIAVTKKDVISMCRTIVKIIKEIEKEALPKARL